MAALDQTLVAVTLSTIVGAVVDYLGAALLVSGVSALLLVSVWGGSKYGWSSPTIIGLIIAATVPNLSGADILLTPHGLIDERRSKEQNEQVLWQVARSTGGVILGHAGAVVLRSFPGALHVRLDGSPGSRVRRAMELEGLDEQTAGRRLRENDRACEACVRHFYRANPENPKLYHLVIEGAPLPLETCAELIIRAYTGGSPARASD